MGAAASAVRKSEGDITEKVGGQRYAVGTEKQRDPSARGALQDDKVGGQDNDELDGGLLLCCPNQ